MAKLAMIIDLDRCVGCKACVLSCQFEWDTTPYKARNWVYQIGPVGEFPDVRTTFYVGLCNHCDDPSCVKACPTHATYKNEKTGVVEIDKELCIGCGYCVEACPYHARFIHPVTKKVDKCSYCTERYFSGKEPACVQACISRARIFGDLEDPESEVHQLVYKGEAYRMETDDVKIGPNTYYIGQKENFDLIIAHYPPEKKHLEPPKAGRLWRDYIKPLILTLAGLSFTGVTIAFITRLILGEKSEEEYEEEIDEA